MTGPLLLLPALGANTLADHASQASPTCTQPGRQVASQ